LNRYFSVMFKMMLSAQPANVQRLSVIVMVGFCAISTLLAWFPDQFSITNCIADGIGRSCPSRSTQSSLLLIFSDALLPFRSLETLAIIFSVLIAFGGVVFTNIFLCALLAFVQMTVCHLRMFVESVQGSNYAALKALFHVFVPYLLLPRHLNMN